MNTEPRRQAVGAMRGLARRVGCVVGAATVCLLATVVPAWARVDGDSTSAAQPATPAAEAWYRPSLTCSLPVGCLPVSPPSPYPAGTLHVGVVAGQEESRTYIALRLPSTELVGGTLRLPVAPSADGTVQPETAKLRACLVTGTVKDKLEGDMGQPPTADCTVSSPAVATTSGSGTVLTVDLAPFAVEWSGGQVGSLALLPADGAAATDVWHLAFSRHDRTGAGVQPLSASLLVPSEEDTFPPTDETTTEPAPGFAPAPQLPVASIDPPAGMVPQIDPGVPESQAPTVAGPASLVPAGQAIDTSFAYPGVFLLPPLVLLASAWVARAFTRDLAQEPR